MDINGAQFLDLKPLSCIGSLRSLGLARVSRYVCLDRLQQLDALRCSQTTATPAVLQLTALTMLALSEGSRATGLSQLSQLVALRAVISSHRWRPEAVAALAAALAEGLPALRNLSCSHAIVPPLHCLAQLTALEVQSHGQRLPGGLQDLRRLTSLAKLGFDAYSGHLDLQSDTVTALQLTPADGSQLPRLVGCSRLSHIMLSLAMACLNPSFDICAAQLGPKVKTLWLLQKRGQLGQLFLEWQIAKVLHVRPVSGFDWYSDPAILDADHH